MNKQQQNHHEQSRLEQTHHDRSSNRKGDMWFMLLIDLLFLVAILTIFTLFNTGFAQQNAGEGIGTRQTALLHTYAVSEQMLLYLDEAARLAAYESLFTVMDKGGVTRSSDMLKSVCGTYASYPLWTEQYKENTCFPELTNTGKQTDVYSTFTRDFRTNLDKILKYPGFPTGTNYDISFNADNGLTIKGVTNDKITLPIMTAKDAAQSALTPLMLSENIAKLTPSSFVPDTTIPGVEVFPSPNYNARESAINMIIIHATGTGNIDEAEKLYVNEPWSTHYIIDLSGKIVQVLPESMSAKHMPSCYDEKAKKKLCSFDNIEQTSISISLVNKGLVPEPPVENQDENSYRCIHDTSGLSPLKKTNWCGTSYYAKISFSCTGDRYANVGCWSVYEKAQIAALKELVAEIARRREIDNNMIFFEDQVREQSDNPGPALKEGSDDQKAWYGTFLGEILTKRNAAPATAAPDAKPSASATVAASQVKNDISNMAIALPMSSTLIPTILSCKGERKLDENSATKPHDGIDIALSEGSDVYAIADGTVEDACSDWVGACACSSYTSTQCSSNCAKKCPGLTGYGNVVVIRHSSGLYSLYAHLKEVLVQKGKTVTRNQLIGKSGNTGNSQGPHLHFGIYNSSSRTSDYAMNPLCLYSEQDLQRFAAPRSKSNCDLLYSGAFTRANSKFAASCNGVSPLSSIPDCTVNTVATAPLSDQPQAAAADPKKTGGNTLEITKKNIMDQEGLLDVIKTEASNNGIDYRLIIAFITQESQGRPDLVSSTGCAGIAQFCWGTATGAPYSTIFGGGFTKCAACEKSPCLMKDSGCAGDPRGDSVKSVKAAAKLISALMVYPAFKGKTDSGLFAIASYNAGQGTISIALSKTIDETKNPNPLWSDVKQHMDRSVISQAFCNGSPGSKLCNDPTTQDKKIKEINDYVDKVSGYFYAQGGSAGTVLTDVTCSGLTVKELGTYSFAPSFSVTVPNVLTSFSRSVDFAKKTYEECDGRNDMDTRECLGDHIDAFNRASADLEIPDTCDDRNQEIFTSVSAAIEDCKANYQRDCLCELYPPSGRDEEVVVNLFGDVPQVFLDGKQVAGPVGDGTVLFRRNAVEAPQRVRLELHTAQGNSFMRAIEKDNGVKIGDFPVGPSFGFVDNGQGDLIWTADTTKIQACGVYDVTHPLCVSVKQPMPHVSTGKIERPVIKFALYLDDIYPPKPVTDGEGTTDSKITFSFTPSKSKDISYYRIFCAEINKPAINAPAAKKPFNEEVYTVFLGRDDADEAITKKISITLDTCNGKQVLPTQNYTIGIEPYDISGNAGQMAILKPKEDDATLVSAAEGAAGAGSGDGSSGATSSRSASGSEAPAQNRLVQEALAEEPGVVKGSLPNIAPIDMTPPAPVTPTTPTISPPANSGPSVPQPATPFAQKTVTSDDIATNLKTDQFYVVKATTMPAMLFESFTLVNMEQQKFYSSPDNLQGLARALGDGILTYRGNHPERKIIFIENGHGNSDPGATDPVTKKTEGSYTFNIQKEVSSYLSSRGFTVVDANFLPTTSASYPNAGKGTALTGSGPWVVLLNYNNQYSDQLVPNKDGEMVNTVVQQRVNWYTTVANNIGTKDNSLYVSIHVDSSVFSKTRPGPSPPQAFVYGPKSSDQQPSSSESTRDVQSRELATNVLRETLGFYVNKFLPTLQ